MAQAAISEALAKGEERMLFLSKVIPSSMNSPLFTTAKVKLQRLSEKERRFRSAGGQKSGVRSQESEVRSQATGLRQLTADR
jgi:hypothetical protein